jgi:predicted metal-dependent HD superfamily phosphohydrolase
MAQDTISAAAEQHIISLLREKLAEDHRYHCLEHTLGVRDEALKLGQAENLSPTELEMLELASLFHDAGFTEVYEGHEAMSRQIAEGFLKRRHYPEDKLQTVLSLIDATYPPKQPATPLEEIIKDADLSHLASEDYLKGLKNLRYEWAVFLNQSYSDEEWFKLNYKFVKKHQFFTAAARERYIPQWQANLKELKQLRDSFLPPETNNKPKAGSGHITGSKSAQMMFKTALRNHLDLSNLADNKANIMLSVNALIITIAMPLAVSFIKSNLFLLIPLGCLLATCLLSMIFATLATRPIPMTGYTPRKQIDEGRSNLFFFGNFYSMKYEEYQEGMKAVIADESYLEGSIMRDLFFLGRSLGNKYRRLRICYNIFMYGIILTVTIFGLTYAIFAL